MLFRVVNFIVMLSVVLLLLGCASEVNYRGVPRTTWQQLSGQQKQLIVDQSFQHSVFENHH